MKTRLLSLLFLFAGFLPELRACPLCMGAQDGPTASAVNNAIFIMFGVLGVIFSGIAAVAFRFYRRIKQIEGSAERSESAANGSDHGDGRSVPLEPVKERRYNHLLVESLKEYKEVEQNA